VDTNEKNVELFTEGLTLLLLDRLVLFRDMSFNALVSVAIDQEGTYQAFWMKKRRRGRGPSQDLLKIVLGVLH
jgi:hypothetical protein